MSLLVIIVLLSGSELGLSTEFRIFGYLTPFSVCNYTMQRFATEFRIFGYLHSVIFGYTMQIFATDA